MISKGDRRLSALSFVYRFLLIIVTILVLLFIGGTIFGVFQKTDPPEHNQPSIIQENEQGQTFTGIGRIRVPTADPQPGMVILFVTFRYNPEDKAFSEELALRIKDFREVIMHYIGSFSAEELLNQSEESIKSEFLHRFNTILRLGKIDTLYFSEFLIIS